HSCVRGGLGPPAGGDRRRPRPDRALLVHPPGAELPRDRGRGRAGRLRSVPRGRAGVSGARDYRRARGKAAQPGYVAVAPSCSSIRRSWLYFATRSLRAGAPVLIWPVPSATARSAIVASSVSPERCDMTVV